MKCTRLFATLLTLCASVIHIRPIQAAAVVPAPREISMAAGWRAADAPIVETTDETLPHEGYTLTIGTEGVRIAAADTAGLRWAHETLHQLEETDASGVRRYPNCTIRDWPAYPWRGVLVDEGRHFFGKATIRKMIEAMAANKLNVFHWHLTEDQGWRVDLKKYPKLAQWGAARSCSPLPGAHNLGDGTPYGPFCYSEDDIAEIVEFAHQHHIRIVPELEIPGHSRAALAAYPEYSCLGERLERRPDTSWGVKRELYCAGNDDAIAFLEGVLDEFCRLFKYSDTIHIGGDECPKSRWRECPKCQARIRKLGLRDENALQSWMTRHFTEYLAAKGKRAIGWEEILDGGVPEGACVMSWLGPKGALKAVTNGVDCVVCPTTYCYFDQQQALTNDPWRVGGGGLPLRKVFGFDPSAGIPTPFRSRVLGSQGLLWSEGITEPEELFWMGFPRLCAMAEALWTADPKRDYDEFCRRMTVHIPRLRAMGVNCAPTPEGIPVNRAAVPVPKIEQDSYDWYRRHDYILAEAKTWRSNPKVVFIGDSITHFWAGRDSIGELDDSLTLPRWKAAFADFDFNVMNLGYGYDRTQNVLWRLEHGELEKTRPDLVVLMIGFNNLGSTKNFRATTPEETAEAVRKIVGGIRRSHPKTRILLMGVLPGESPRSTRRAAITRLNRLLRRIPSYGYDGMVDYLDIGDKYLGAGGEIPRSLMSDLVHPTDAGYALWARALRPYLERVRSADGRLPR